MNFDQREGVVDTDVAGSDSCQRLRFMNRLYDMTVPEFEPGG